MKLRVSLLLAGALWSIPVATFACDGTATPSYANITAIYFRSDGLTPPVAVPANVALDAGDCPVGREALVWRQGASMNGGLCARSQSGKPTRCCPATFATDDLPAQIFARLLAVLERDRFYDLAPAESLASAQNAAVLEVAVLRCMPKPDWSTILAALRKPNPQTTVLRIVVPFGMKPATALGPGVARFLDDFTLAVYQSKWYGQDVY